MTRRLRIVGVVVVAMLIVAIPALANGQGRAGVRAAAGTALLCRVSTPTGAAGLVVTTTSLSTARRHARSRHRGRHKKPSKQRGKPANATSGVPCVPPCGPVVGDSRGATGATGCELPYPCPLSATASVCPPIPCAVTQRGGQDDPAGTTPICPPIPCPIPYIGAAGATGPTVSCEPPCPGAAGAPVGATATTSCWPVICALGSSTQVRSATGPTGPVGPPESITSCPPIPSCPPLPRPSVTAAHEALYACPQVATSAAISR